MGRLFFDLLVILAVGKEAYQLLLANRLNPSIAVLALVGVPFLMGATKPADRTIVITPFANLIRLLVSLLSLVIFLVLDRLSLAPGLGPLLLIMTMPGLRIPVISATHSGRFRPASPLHSGHLFRRIPATLTGA